MTAETRLADMAKACSIALHEAGRGIVVTRRRDFDAHRDFYEASSNGTLARGWSEDEAVVRLTSILLDTLPEEHS